MCFMHIIVCWDTSESNLVFSGENTTARRNNMNQVNEASFMRFKTITPFQQKYQQSPLIQHQHKPFNLANISKLLQISKLNLVQQNDKNNIN
jgi:hypothetical protein